jgi:hypothetical protein
MSLSDQESPTSGSPAGGRNNDHAETFGCNSDEGMGTFIGVNHVATQGKSRAYDDADQVSCEVKDTGGCRCTGYTSPR